MHSGCGAPFALRGERAPRHCSRHGAGRPTDILLMPVSAALSESVVVKDSSMASRPRTGSCDAPGRQAPRIGILRPPLSLEPETRTLRVGALSLGAGPRRDCRVPRLPSGPARAWTRCGERRGRGAAGASAPGPHGPGLLGPVTWGFCPWVALGPRVPRPSASSAVGRATVAGVSRRCVMADSSNTSLETCQTPLGHRERDSTGQTSGA